MSKIVHPEKISISSISNLTYSNFQNSIICTSMLEMFCPLTAGEQFNFLCTGTVYYFMLGLYFELNVKVELFSAHRLLDHFNHVKILFLGLATSHLMCTFFPNSWWKSSSLWNWKNLHNVRWKLIHLISMQNCLLLETTCTWELTC